MTAVQAGAERLGARLRELRRARGLTLVQVAAATGLSHPFLSQVERGRANLSLPSLRKVALALETSPVELLAIGERGPSEGEVELVRAGAGVRTPEGFSSADAIALAHGGRSFTPILVEGDNAEPGEAVAHDQEEFVYVLDGRVWVETGEERHALDVGDSVFIGGGVAHRAWSRGGPYRLMVVKQR